MSLSLSVDSLAVQVEPGATVLDAINRLGVSIPQLCKDPEQPPKAACRTCLVQVEGMRGFPASCALPAREGMVVHTRGEELDDLRAGILELTEAMNAEGCTDRRQTARCELHAALRHCRAEGANGFERLPNTALDASNPFFTLNMEQCILCARCTTACDDVQTIGAIALLGRGHGTKIGTFMDRPIAQSVCTSCGQCVAACPTGAISAKKVGVPVVKEVSTTCPYCGVGCGIKLQVGAGDRLVAVQDEPGNRSSLGTLCVKGRFGFEYVNHGDRLTTPLIRRGDGFVRASWDEALELVAEKLAEHRGSFAGLASAKATNEDGYVMQKFGRAVMGTNSIDHCTRLCHSPSVHAMLKAMGTGATSNSYDDYENAGCLMVVGSDATSNHPVIAIRFRRAVARGAKLIVVNPKYIDLCYQADIWLRQKPGTDVALFNGLAKIVLDEGLADEEFIRARTEGFEEWRASLEPYTPEHVSRITEVPVGDLLAAARTFARPPFSGSCMIWGMGVTQHTNGTDNAHAVLNLSFVTGQVGKPGSGISPLRGQNNVQGCGDAGCIPDNLPGYQGLTAEARAKFGDAWGVELPSTPGLTVTDMVEAADRGELKAMYVVGENPLLAEPDLSHAGEAMKKLEFLVVQDIFMHETAEITNVILPACSFAEKHGTFTNSERRVQLVRRAIAPVGETRPDWEIVSEVARRVSAKLGRPTSQFSYESAAEIFDEMARLTPIIAGISHRRLEQGGIQWPCPSPDHPGTPVLFAERFNRGLAKFFPVRQGPIAEELPDQRYPLILNTGRVLYHWHGGTLTRRVQGLLERVPDVPVLVHPGDVPGISTGDRVRVASRRGSMEGSAVVTEDVRRGEVFVPFVRLGDSAANFLTNAVYDPESRMPEYKVCAVAVEPARGRPRKGAGMRPAPES